MIGFNLRSGRILLAAVALMLVGLSGCGGGGGGAGAGPTAPPSASSALSVHEDVADDAGRVVFPGVPGGAVELWLTDPASGEPLAARQVRLATDGVRGLLVVDGGGHDSMRTYVQFEDLHAQAARASALKSALSAGLAAGGLVEAAADLFHALHLTRTELEAQLVARDDVADVLARLLFEDLVLDEATAPSIDLVVKTFARAGAAAAFEVASVLVDSVGAVRSAHQALVVANYPADQLFDIYVTEAGIWPLRGSWVTVLPHEGPASPEASATVLTLADVAASPNPGRPGVLVGVQFTATSQGGEGLPAVAASVSLEYPDGSALVLGSLVLPPLASDRETRLGIDLRLPAGVRTGAALLRIDAATGATASTPFRVEAPPATYALSPLEGGASEDDGWITFDVSRTGALESEVLIVSTLQSEGHGNRGDYEGWLDREVHLAAGVRSGTVSIRVLDDVEPEGDESFALIVQRTTQAETVDHLARATFRISDDDTGATSHALSPTSTSISEGAGDVTFTLTRSGQLPSTTLYVSTVTDEGSGNSEDYLGWKDVPVALGAGVGTASVTVSLIDDAKAEGTERFAVIVQRSPSDPTTSWLARAEFEIRDDDADEGDATTYSISPKSADVGEEDGSLTYTVTRAGALPNETLYVSTAQTEGDQNSSDYVGKINEKLTFSSGVATKTVRVTILDDTLSEGDQTFALLVQRSGSDPTSTYLTKATFTIEDDETSYSFSPTSKTVDEDAGTVTFSIRREGKLPSETLYVSTTQTEGSKNVGDYVGKLNEAISFGAGVSSKSVTVTLSDDSLDESNETFGLIVQRSGSDAATVYLAKAKFTIRDDD